MLSKEKLRNLLNVLNLDNNYYIKDTDILNVLTAINNGDDIEFLKALFNISPENHKELDTHLIDNVFTLIKHEPSYKDDVLDSYTDSQVKAKRGVVDGLDKLNLLNKDAEVVIWGCWYGSVLVPLLHDKVKRIVCIDSDETAIEFGKNRLFKEYDNVEWMCHDIFEEYREVYDTTDIFINTSCEHMLPMKWWGPEGPRSKHNHFKEWDGVYHEWPVYKRSWWDRIKPNAHFAFTSNNMFDIPGHINCVKSVDEFKNQLPKGSEVLFESDISDERGIRWILIGKL
jgi:hypothetical protein